MDAVTLKSMTVELNGRKLYPELENCFPQYAKDLQAMMQGVLKLSRSFPLDLEPAPVFTPGLPSK
jgi:hypothetical protein